MMSTEKNRLSTACQSPPRPPSRRLPLVASGERHDDYDEIFNWSGYTLTVPHFGTTNGVHLYHMSLSPPLWPGHSKSGHEQSGKAYALNTSHVGWDSKVTVF